VAFNVLNLKDRKVVVMSTQAEAIIELVTHEHASDLGYRVEELFYKCLFQDSELNAGQPCDGVIPVIAEGITSNVGFHPSRIANAKPRVIEFIKQMPDEFMKSKGGGWSFLNLCNDRNGHQWANLHRTMEQLVQLAIGCGLGGYALPRDMWSMLPGGMPYVWFSTDAELNEPEAGSGDNNRTLDSPAS
jgi:hypothetical protein